VVTCINNSTSHKHSIARIKSPDIMASRTAQRTFQSKGTGLIQLLKQEICH